MSRGVSLVGCLLIGWISRLVIVNSHQSLSFTLGPLVIAVLRLLSESFALQTSSRVYVKDFFHACLDILTTLVLVPCGCQ